MNFRIHTERSSIQVKITEGAPVQAYKHKTAATRFIRDVKGHEGIETPPAPYENN